MERDAQLRRGAAAARPQEITEYEGQEVNPSAALDRILVDRLQGAGKAVEDTLQEHDRFPELNDMFTNALYTTMDYSPDSKPAFRLLKMIPFPETLHQMYRCTYTMNWA